MKKKLLSIALGVAMVASMLAGCGNSAGTSAPAESAAPAPAESKEEAPAASADAAETTADTAEASAEITGKIYLVSKGFQHQFWQAVLQGANEAAEKYGVEIDFQGPDTESDIAQQVQMLNNAFNNNPPAIGLAAWIPKRVWIPLRKSRKPAFRSSVLTPVYPALLKELLQPMRQPTTMRQASLQQTKPIN